MDVTLNTYNFDEGKHFDVGRAFACLVATTLKLKICYLASGKIVDITQNT